MKNIGYAIDRRITDVIGRNKFTISAEIVPPRNGEQRQSTLEKVQRIVQSGVDFLSVTKGAGGSLRGGSLPIAQSIKEQMEKPCIAHFTCRDLLPEEIENLLVDHHYFGVRNILALRGDPPIGCNEWQEREGGYSYAYQLIEQIKKLNQGEFIPREGFKTTASPEKMDFCIGCAVYPEHPNEKERIDFVRQKVLAGAEYGISQMLFDPEVYIDLMASLKKINIDIPILPGLRILRSRKQARVMETRFGCRVPLWYIDALPETVEKGAPISFDVLKPFYRLMRELKSGGAPGAHIFVLNDVELCCEAVNTLRNEL